MFQHPSHDRGKNKGEEGTAIRPAVWADQEKIIRSQKRRQKSEFARSGIASTNKNAQRTRINMTMPGNFIIKIIKWRTKARRTSYCAPYPVHVSQQDQCWRFMTWISKTSTLINPIIVSFAIAKETEGQQNTKELGNSAWRCQQTQLEK